MKTPLFPTGAVAGLIGFLAGGVSVSVFSAGSTHAQTEAAPQPIKSSNFQLVDKEGRKMGEWALDASGKPSLRLFDARGNVVWSTDLRIQPAVK